MKNKRRMVGAAFFSHLICMAVGCLPVLAMLSWMTRFASAASIESGQRPNVILVMTDDQGYEELSVHGNCVIATPHIDRLHAQSLRLIDFHATPMCTPTRGQLITGVEAVRNGGRRSRLKSE